MASLDMTSMDPALKQLYRPAVVNKLVWTNRPLTAWIPKFEQFGGRNMPIPLQYSNPAGRSVTFANAQTYASAAGLEDFLLTRVKDYSVATVDGETADASEGDTYAFLSAMKTQVDGAMNALADAIEMFIPRNGTGSIGVASATSTVYTTLNPIYDVVNFEVNMEVRSSATDGATLRTGSATITAINRTTGVLTTDSNWASQITSFVDGDYLSAYGDGQNGGSSATCLAGFQAWLPTSVTATAFFGVDRTTDTRLGGQYYDRSSGTVEEALIDGQSESAMQGGTPDVAWVNNVQFRRLIKEVGSKVMYDKISARGAGGEEASIGFRAVMLDGDKGPIKVGSAYKMPVQTGVVAQTNSWALNTLGPAVKLLTTDGLKVLRQASADGYEVRVGSYGNVSCNAPIWNVRLLLPSP